MTRGQVRQWVFLVGGMGTRLGAMTADTPKPLLPVGGRPFLEYLLDRAVQGGAGEILLLAGYRADKVLAAYEGRSWQGAAIRCSVEAEPLGTAGALRQAAPLLDERWLLLNGDTLFDVDPAALERPEGNWLVNMALRLLPETGCSGVVALEDGRVCSFRERGSGEPGLVNAGVYLMRRALLDLIPAGRACSLEGELFPDLAEAGQMSGTVLDGYFIDIGVPDDYTRAQSEVLALVSPFFKPGPLFSAR